MGIKPNNVSRIMSTQHPDNVHVPFFANNPILSGEDEIKEAFYSFSHLKVKEQLWDCEGKEVDNFVVKKLLTKYEPFFKKNYLGKDRFLTLRVPNPEFEKNEAKILLETLESIPRSFDVAKIFYGPDNEIPPIFEATVPMVTSHHVITRIREYYKQFVFGKQHTALFDGDKEISQWIGSFNPEDIRVTPLFEDKEYMLNADKITEEYMNRCNPGEYQRVWLARSDPAMNYGSAAAVLIEKVVLQRLYGLQERSSIPIMPILGCGSAPFRGHFTPETAGQVMKGYPSIHTYTIQSAYKYDYDEQVVRDSVDEIESAKTSAPTPIDETRALELIEKIAEQYKREIHVLAPLVNSLARFVPQRRRRVLHVGLFGYSRVSEGVSLPRAIKFTAALYSVGLPPELLGLAGLSEKDFDDLRVLYSNFDFDHNVVKQYYNADNLHLLPDSIREGYKKAASFFDAPTDEKHKKITGIIAQDYVANNPASMDENVLRAAGLRKFLG